MKAFKIIGLVVLILLILAGGAGTYYFYNQHNQQKRAEQDLQKQIEQLKKQLVELQKAASQAKESTASEEWQTCAEFSAEDRNIISDWRTYTNDTYHYRFKYPADWTLSADEPESIEVRGTDSGEEISFQARAARMTEMGFGEFNKVFTRAIKVNCENTTENTYDGPDNLTLVTESFTKSEIPYLLIFSYKDIGASYAADIVAINNLILKTFDFSS